MNGIGAHEVVIETPQQSDDPGATAAEIDRRRAVGLPRQVLDLKNDKRFRYVLIFKNHGEAAGASWSTPTRN